MRRAVLLVCAVALLAGCGLPTDGRAVLVDPDDIDFGLDATTTTSRQTTTNPSATTTTAAATTTSPDLVDSVTFAFVSGSQIVPVTRPMPQPVSTERVLAELQRGPMPGEGPPGTRSSVQPGMLRSVSVTAGVATVDLSRSVAELPPSEQLLVAAQVTTTLAGPQGRPGIGQVAFTLESVPIAAPLPGGVQAAGPVSADAYAQLVRPS